MKLRDCVELVDGSFPNGVSVDHSCSILPGDYAKRVVICDGRLSITFERDGQDHRASTAILSHEKGIIAVRDEMLGKKYCDILDMGISDFGP